MGEPETSTVREKLRKFIIGSVDYDGKEFEHTFSVLDFPLVGRPHSLIYQISRLPLVVVYRSYSEGMERREERELNGLDWKFPKGLDENFSSSYFTTHTKAVERFLNHIS